MSVNTCCYLSFLLLYIPSFCGTWLSSESITCSGHPQLLACPSHEAVSIHFLKTVFLSIYDMGTQSFKTGIRDLLDQKITYLTNFVTKQISLKKKCTVNISDAFRKEKQLRKSMMVHCVLLL